MPFTRNPLNVRDIPENRAAEAVFDLVGGRLASDNLATQGVGFGTNLTMSSIVHTSGSASVGAATVIAGAPAGNLGGVYVTGRFASTAAGSFTLTHGLGRPPIGYVECRQDASGTLYSMTISSTITTGPPIGTSTVSSNWNSSQARFSCPIAATKNVAWIFF